MESVVTQLPGIEQKQGDAPGNDQVDKNADDISFYCDTFGPDPQEYIQAPERQGQYHDRENGDQPFVEWVPVHDGDGGDGHGPDDRRGIQGEF